MATIRIQKGAIDGGSAHSRRAEKGAPAARRAGGSGMWVGFAAAIAAMAGVIVICAVGNSGRRYTTEYAPPTAPQSSSQATSRSDAKKFDELNGMTMKEWMQKHNTNNAMLKARQDGVKSRNWRK